MLASDKQFDLSVIICAHNPRPDYLERVFESLRKQSLSFDHWELLFIDNASNKQLASETDLSWQPNSRHIREDELGLTPARLRGIGEAKSGLIVFVDDDNILDLDYLEVSLTISRDYPFLGAWGGQVFPEFEIQPPEWTKSYWGLLALRQFDQDKWSNLFNRHETTPCGAGLCVRKFVAENYAEAVCTRTDKIKLDRKGQELSSCGDSDLAFTACDLGLGTGIFQALKVTHLIPAIRLEVCYLEKLVEGTTYSETILYSFRGQVPTITLSWPRKFLNGCRRLSLSSNARRLEDASRRGFDRAMRELNEGS